MNLHATKQADVLTETENGDNETKDCVDEETEGNEEEREEKSANKLANLKISDNEVNGGSIFFVSIMKVLF